ncbi:MAG TPA: histidine kinase dimerization/phospho-acceptor domain-containing protein, partial [Polyangiaceae bacterium]|nr:histidine kinase dimerization/phospho-acceptor domain-containing protein [Polyangiaceae bacterium]
MASLGDMSWRELVQELRALRRSERSDLANHDFVGLLHELQVHQVELEVRNRELREVQERLEASRARYAELYDRAPVGYATLDEHGVVVDINLTGAALLGRERDQLIGVRFAAVAVQNAPAFLNHLRFSATNAAPATADVEMKHGRRKLVLQLTTTPDFSAERGLVGYRTVMSDVTERRRIEAARDRLEDERRAREAAIAANHMKDQFLGIVSHELRTPLNAMMGWTQILSRHMHEPDLVDRGLQVMQRNGQALAHIVDDILDVSR